MSLVETDWLENNKDKVKIIDCSWHMPQTKRNGFEEYKTQHIPESIFFDFIYYGHDPKLVHVLNGGLKKWLEEKRKVTNNLSKVMKSDYKSFENQELVKNKDSINQNIETQNFRVVDARSKERFEGKVPEPREGLKSGSIKNSVCIPFGSCLNQDRTFRNKQELEKIFQSSLKNLNDKNIVFSCGSGVTACVLALAYSLINDKYRPCIYDGSWAEYGLI